MLGLSQQVCQGSRKVRTSINSKGSEEGLSLVFEPEFQWEKKIPTPFLLSCLVYSIPNYLTST